MNISYQWLQSILPIKKSPEELAKILTHTGLEVSGMTPFEFFPSGLVIGQVVSCEEHPKADRLKKTKVDIGQPELLSIVCGAPNIATGQKVVVAKIGTQLSLPDGHTFEIKERAIRGELSQGMICAEDEIGLSSKHEEIIVLDTKRPVGTSLATAWNTPPDTRIEIELTPNRNDAMSHEGVARDLAAVWDYPIKEELLKPLIPTTSLPIQIQVDIPEKCPRYTGVVLDEVSIGPSPIWLQNRLRSIGVEPINNIVDITQFIMHDIGQPIHAFDYDQIIGKQIYVKHLSKGTSFTTLDGVHRVLNGEEIMICDAAGPLCMGGVLGGERGKITEQTSRVFIESAYFDPITISRTLCHHQLQTDAGFRYERGTDPSLPYKALHQTAQLIQQHAKGIIASPAEDHNTHPLSPAVIPMSFAQLEQVIGVALPQEKVLNIIKRLGMTILESTPSTFTVVVPMYRRDVTRPIDVIEEILRIYGYNNIPISSNGLHGVPSHQENGLIRKKRELASLLASRGLYEIKCNAITHQKHATQLGLTAHDQVNLANPLSQSLSCLRKDLLSSMLETIQYNLNRQIDSLRLFEIGKTYHHTEQGYREEEHLSIGLAGNREQANWLRKTESASLRDLQGLFHYIFAYNHLLGIIFEEKKDPRFSIALSIKNTKGKEGILGLVSPKLLQTIGIKMPVWYGCLPISFFDSSYPAFTYQPIPKFPRVSRDISFVLDQTVPFTQIEHCITSSSVPYLQDFFLVDVYKDDGTLGKNKSAYTFRFSLRHPYKTLKDKEILASLNHIEKALQEKLHALIRD